MSAYYRWIKRIFSEYNVIATSDVFAYFSIVWIFIMSIMGIIFVSQEPLTDENSSSFLIIVAGVSFFLSKYVSKKNDKKRFKGIAKLIDNHIIELEAIEKLITELEDYIKSIKKICQWSIGILATLIIVLVSFTGTLITKIMDIAYQLADEGIKKEIFSIIIKEMNNGNADYIDAIFKNGFWLLVLISIPLFLGYGLFSVITLKKKQVLLILYDIRYCVLSPIYKEEPKD